MPELPEIYITACLLKNVESFNLVKITSKSFNKYKKINKTYISNTVNKVYQNEKAIILETALCSIEIRLGLTGYILLTKTKIKIKNSRSKIELINYEGESIFITLVDDRGFGNVTLSQNKYKNKKKFLTERAFKENIIQHKTNIFNSLINPKVAPGVGSYIAHEALYRSKITPMRIVLTNKEISKLYENINKIISESIAANGATWGSFKYPDGSTGDYYNDLKVYGKKNKSCAACGNEFCYVKIRKRGVTYCSYCQV